MATNRIYQTRRPQINMQQRRADLGGLFGGAAKKPAGPSVGGPPATLPAVDLSGLNDQGPTQAGGTLAGITAPGVSRDIIQSRFGPRIDLGPILRPRSTGANPMEGDPFQATSGVGGFFRRLLGDNADELNAQWQVARMQAAMNQAGLDAQRKFELEKLGLQNKNALDLEALRNKNALEAARYSTEISTNAQLARDAANRAAQQAWDAGAPQRKSAAEQQELTDKFGDPILASNYRAQLAQAELDKLTSQAGLNDARGDAATMRGLGLGGGGGGGRSGADANWRAVGERFVQSPDGKLYRTNDVDALEEVQMPGQGGGQPPGGLTDEQRAAASERAKLQRQQNVNQAVAQRSSVGSGLMATLGQLPSVLAESPLGQAVGMLGSLGSAAISANPISQIGARLAAELSSAGGGAELGERADLMEKKLKARKQKR